MYYTIYLIGIVLFLLNGIGFSNLSGFSDSITLVLVLFPCLLMLFCTRFFRPFGECFLFAFGKRDYSLLQSKRCLHSIRMVMLTSALSGTICVMISVINMLHSLDLASGSLAFLGIDISVAMLSLFYVLIVCIILLPLHFMLKQHMIDLADRKEHISEEGT